MVNELAVMLAFTILVNCIQPDLTGKDLDKHLFSLQKRFRQKYLVRFRYMFLFLGVAVGPRWQAKAAFVNIGCYYLVGVPLALFWFGCYPLV